MKMIPGWRGWESGSAVRRTLASSAQGFGFALMMGAVAGLAIVSEVRALGPDEAETSAQAEAPARSPRDAQRAPSSQTTLACAPEGKNCYEIAGCARHSRDDSRCSQRKTWICATQAMAEACKRGSLPRGVERVVYQASGGGQRPTESASRLQVPANPPAGGGGVSLSRSIEAQPAAPLPASPPRAVSLPGYAPQPPAAATVPGSRPATPARPLAPTAPARDAGVRDMDAGLPAPMDATAPSNR
jgi:hypothetical protein